jgi:hypothetical protein
MKLFLASGDKIIPVIAFGRGFLVGEGRTGAGVFSDTLDISESYELG